MEGAKYRVLSTSDREGNRKEIKEYSRINGEKKDRERRRGREEEEERSKAEGGGGVT